MSAKCLLFAICVISIRVTAIPFLQSLADTLPVQWIPSFAGPYRLQFDKFYLCESNGNMIIKYRPFYVHLKELQKFTGNATLKRSFTDADLMQMKADSWSQNMWKPNAFIMNFPKACSAMRDHSPMYFTTLFGKAAKSGSCAVPPGVYFLNNTPIDWSDPKIPIMPYGKYRMHLKIYKDDASQVKNVNCCFVAEVQIIPVVANS